MNALRMALDSIREKKGRSFLTMLGIIIGVTAVLVLVALVSGYNADITAYYEKLGVNKVNVTVNWYDTSRSVDVIDALYDYGNGELGDMVLGVSPDLSTSLPMKYRTTTLDSGTLYLGSDQFAVCGNYTLKEGRDISAFDVDRRSRVCVLGSYVADSLFQYADPIGETVYFGGEPFTVVGIYYQKDGGEEGSMDDMAVIPYSLDRAILGTAQLTRCWFPTKTYDGFALPAGEYEALRVVIGDGRGQNWWCVAFPPLCLEAASETVDEAAAAGYFSPGQAALITEEDRGYVLKFKAMELLGEWKGLLCR